MSSIPHRVKKLRQLPPPSSGSPTVWTGTLANPNRRVMPILAPLLGILREPIPKFQIHNNGNLTPKRENNLSNKQKYQHQDRFNSRAETIVSGFPLGSFYFQKQINETSGPCVSAPSQKSCYGFLRWYYLVRLFSTLPSRRQPSCVRLSCCGNRRPTSTDRELRWTSWPREGASGR